MDGHGRIGEVRERMVGGGFWRDGVRDWPGVPFVDPIAWAERIVRPQQSPTVIVAGRGALSSWKELRAYAEDRLIPVVCSMGGIGAMPSDHVLYRGMLGHTGDARANKAIAEARTIIALGTRLDMRQTGTAPDLWAGKYVIMVNEDQAELDQARVVLSEAYRMTVTEWLHVQGA